MREEVDRDKGRTGGAKAYAPGKPGPSRWLLFAGLMAVIFLLPLIIVAIHAVAARWTYPGLLPQEFTARGVLLLLENGGEIAGSLLSSTAYSTATVVLSFLVSLLPASVLARYEFHGRIALEALLMSPVLVPAITYGMGIHFLFIRIGLVDTLPGVVLVLTAAAYP